MARAGLLLVTALALGLGHTANRSQNAPLEWWTTHALEKIDARATPPAVRPSRVELSAARNEFEPFQLVLSTRSRALHGVDVELGELVGERTGERIPTRWSTIYLQHYLHLTRPSSVEGHAGAWPDPLLPRTDPYTGERRASFPFELSPGRNQALWVELYVPLEASPDVYRGSLEISVGGETTDSVPIHLRVWSFALPSTSSLPTSFGLSGPAVLTQHHGRYTEDADLFALSRLYALAALRHRISLHGGDMVPPKTSFDDADVTIDWTSYDERHAPLLDGTVFGPDQPLPGARTTSIDLTTMSELTPDQTESYWREWARHFRERGWLDRLFVYLMDEPSQPEDVPEVARRGRLARAADPELRTLLTEQLTSALDEVVDLWTPLVNCFEARPDGDPYCEEIVPRSAYRRVEQRGAEVWWYQSCASHGCSQRGGRGYTGWPSYAIDAPATAHRVMPWLAWNLGIAGELYYNTVESYLGDDADPWTKVRLHGGNGDGTLFYPGTPDRIGGESDIPIPSLRLKLIREGLEDYEYLVLAEDNGLISLAREQGRGVADGTFTWNRQPAAFYQARAALGSALDQLADGSETRR